MKRQDSVGFRILGRIRRGRRARVWATREFVDLGSRSAVDVALHRLETKDLIRRISWGLYDLPRYERDVLVPPDPGEVLDAIERGDGVKFLPDERSAAQRLGLIAGTPKRLVVLTSSQLEAIALGQSLIEFVTVAPGRLVWAGRPAAYVVQAMRHLRKRIVRKDDELDLRLRELLEAKNGAAIRKDLERGLGDLPIWLIPHVKTLLRSARR